MNCGLIFFTNVSLEWNNTTFLLSILKIFPMVVIQEGLHEVSAYKKQAVNLVYDAFLW